MYIHCSISNASPFPLLFLLNFSRSRSPDRPISLSLFLPFTHPLATILFSIPCPCSSCTLSHSHSVFQFTFTFTFTYTPAQVATSLSAPTNPIALFQSIHISIILQSFFPSPHTPSTPPFVLNTDRPNHHLSCTINDLIFSANTKCQTPIHTHYHPTPHTVTTAAAPSNKRKQHTHAPRPTEHRPPQQHT